jgi:diguanylate cyclase (GGDEF)-like protein
MMSSDTGDNTGLRENGKETAASPQDNALPEEARDAILELIVQIDELKAEIIANNARIEELEVLADIDPLTPAANRRAFLRELTRTQSYIKRYGGTASLLYIDVDGMKEINDRLGHAAGDRALLAVVEILQSNIRSSDMVGRLGGDEFGVLLARADRAAGDEKSESLMRQINKIRIKASGGDFLLSASCGIVEINKSTSPEQAIAAADREMYTQKSEKKS